MNSVGDNLKRIRLLNGMSLKKAGDLMGMSATAVSKYEKGLIHPDSEKIIQFADIYNVKCIDILKVYEVPKMKFDSFRKKASLKGYKLELLKEIIQNEVTNYLEVLKLNNISKQIKLKQYDCNSLEDIEDITNTFRKSISIANNQPISDLINTLENLGIIIIEIANINNLFDEFDGLSEIVNGFPIIVIRNDLKDGARQRFTIAHELGHLLLNITNERLDKEKVCHRFASSLLMPKDAVISEFGSNRNNISNYELKAFKNEYKVSFQPIIYRLKDLNIISDYLYKKLCIYFNKTIGKNDPSPIKVEKSYQYKRLVYKLEYSNIITLNKACELMGVSEYEYNKENNYY